MDALNEDELNAPKWLDTDFFSKVLRKYENVEQIQIIRLALNHANKKSDHFSSLMLRAKVLYQYGVNSSVHHKSLIIKTMPEKDCLKREVLIETQAFENEIAMYEKTLPKITEILAAQGDPVQFAPNLLYAELTPHKVIVLEDLCERGYAVERDHQRLKATEMEQVLQKLAKLHAVSYMLGKSVKDSEIVTHHRLGLFNHAFAYSNKLIAGGIKRFIEMLDAHEDLQSYGPLLRKIEQDIFESCRRLYHAYMWGEKDEIYVLNHGDFHRRNLMFKFDKKNQLKDVLMVDYQISVFGPAAIDLLYATYMVLSPELRAQRDSFYRKYFKQFIETLKLIKYEGELPQFKQLEKANLRYRYFSVFLLCTFLPAIYSHASKLATQKEHIDLLAGQNSKVFSILYQSPAYVAEVKELLPILLNAELISMEES